MKRFCGFLCIAVSAIWAVTISTDHVNNSRLGWNSAEMFLTPTNVTTATFQKIGTDAVDGAVYGSELAIDGVSVSGVSRNILIVATMNCSIYAFDQNSPGTQLWTNHLCSPRTSYPDDGFLYHQPVGCLSTPVADVASGFVYVACTNTTPTWVLYQVNMSTGAVNASVTISGTFGGLAFAPGQELQRTGLVLANGNVYVGFSGYDDEPPWNGWMFAYSTSSLSRVGLFATTPTGSGGGIWQAGGGAAVDGSGNLIMATGNGDYDGTSNFANSIIKLGPTLSLVDWFTPANWATLSSEDLDMASGRVMLIPGTSLLALGEKDFNVYVIDETCMGHLQGSGSGCTSPVIFPTNAHGTTSHSSGIYGGLFMNGIGYWPNTAGGPIYAFTFSAGAFNQTPLAISSATYAFPGAQMQGSSIVASNTIVWSSTFATSPFSAPTNGTLRALNPTTLAELWNSDTRAGDSFGHMTKFTSPVVVNGKVYVSSYDNAVAVFGLVPASSLTGQASISGQAVIQ